MKRPLTAKILIVSIIVIIISGFIVYGNSLDGKFLYDDDALIVNNRYIKDWSSVTKIFTEDAGAGAGRRYGYYRPLQIFSYLIDYSLWKFNTIGYHLTNILLHILAALCIYWFISILSNDRLLSLLTGLFFVIHPINTEAVSYISGRSDSLGLIFILLCFIFYIKYLHANSTKFYILMIFSYVSALLSRENALILPVLLLLYHYSFKKKIKLKAFAPVLIFACVYILLRYAVLKSAPLNTSWIMTIYERIPGFFVAITNYIRLLILPFDLHVEYGSGSKLFGLTEPKVLLGIAASFLLLIYAARKRKSNGLIFFSIFWFFIALLPVSNVYPLPFYMAEHFLYIPSIGFFLILAKGLSSLHTRKEFQIIAVLLSISLFGFYSYLTIKQNNYWKDPIFFYKRTLIYVKDSSSIYHNLGNTYKDIGKKEEAIASYRRAIEINPNHIVAHNNLGNTYKDIGKKEQAIASYKKAIEIDPNYADAHNNLGNAYKDIGKKEQAIASYMKAIEIDHNHAGAHNNLGVLYQETGKEEEAIAFYKKAISLNPYCAETYNNLANIYGVINKKEAIALYNKAIAINPDYAEAYHNLSVIYFQNGQYELAIEYCDKAKELGISEAALLKAIMPYRE